MVVYERSHMKRLSSLQAWLKSFAAKLTLGFALLLLFSNIGMAFFLHQQTGGRQFLAAHLGQSNNAVLVTPVNAQQVLVGTLANEVRLEQNGRTIQHMQFPDLIGGLAVSMQTGAPHFYVGTADGNITELDANFQQVSVQHVDGRIVALQSAPGEGFLVGYGSGAYSSNYHVAYYNAKAKTPVFISSPGSHAISALYVRGNSVAYGTAKSEVTMLDAATGKVRWATTLAQPISRLLVLADNRVLAGDNAGNVTLIDTQGHAVWQLAASNYAIRSLVFDEQRGYFLIGDAQGALFVLDTDGNIQTTQNVAGDDVQEVLPAAGNTYLLIPRNGPWQTVDPTAVPAIVLGDTLKPYWITFNALCGLCLVISFILATSSLRNSSRATLMLIKKKRIAYLFTLPAIALIIVFCYYPILTALYYSLTNFSLQNVTQFVGLQNYGNILFNDIYFRTGLLNMVLIVIANILKTITFPLLAAELVFWVRNNVHRYIFRTLFVLPSVVPGLVLTFMWRMVYDPNTGLLNQLLGSLGLAQFQHAWLGDERTALGSIISVGFPFISAFAFLVYMGGLLNINAEMYDAAQVDGANWLDRFLKIDLPFLMPQFRILFFFVIAGTVQGFVDIFVMTAGGPGTATYVPALQMYLNIADGHFGYASAIGIILFIMIVIPTVFVLLFKRQSTEEVA
ncbi:binding-protein-dependent transport systems inner membrane component [Ktedonobacter racemifer DSM 44963]|uniref:Binding-protein-dependent transport systems inner membrane component n=2 Tax=Ktedonobacter racemifer TaxID=363277 RepID=D6U3I1_KTERA|nr:binding-protein-dependent transport systems inner membrane component [Ktedonobacter racemifer DSM 44963]